MNNLDRQYKELLQDILDNGVKKEDRTGTGTLSVFGRQIRHKMSEGFPILTSKKIHFKSLVTEALWFLKGRTDLRYLLENDCHIWTGDAYRVYDKDFDREHPPFSAPYTKRLTKEEFEGKIVSDDEFNKIYGNLGPIYGKQWRSWEHYDEIGQHYSSETKKIEKSDILRREPIDQISNLINDLKTNPDSRRLMVSAWNPSDLESSVLPPCHYGFQVWTRELSLTERGDLYVDKTKSNRDELIKLTHTPEEWDSIFLKHKIPSRAISLIWSQRSVDVGLGLPFNVSSYGLLLVILAKEVNMVSDEVIGNLGDTHLYLNHIDPIKEQLTRESYPLPNLLFKDEYWYLNDLDISFPEKIEKFKPDFFKLENYQSHPAIKMPLSN